MVEIVLVRPAVSCLNDVESRQFRKNQLKQSTVMQLMEPDAGMCGQKNLVQLLCNTFPADNLQSFDIAAKGIFCLRLDIKAQLRGETHTTKHTQRIVRESNIWIQRRPYQSVFQVVQAVKGIYQFAKTFMIQADGHRIYGEVSPLLIIFQGTVFHHRLARIMTIAFLTRTNELHFYKGGRRKEEGGR